MKLLFGRQLAEQLGVSLFYVATMKKMGCPFRGRKTSMLWARKWLEANPDFKTTSAYGKRKERVNNRVIPSVREIPLNFVQSMQQTNSTTSNQNNEGI